MVEPVAELAYIPGGILERDSREVNSASRMSVGIVVVSARSVARRVWLEADAVMEQAGWA